MQSSKSHEVPQAGAIAFRKRENILEVLLVRPSSGQHEWLFPKGHIEPHEVEADTALRELREEAGVTGNLIGAVDLVSRFVSKQQQVAVRFYVVEAHKSEPPAESREHIWLPMLLAAEALTHDHNRLILSEALPIIEGHLAQSGGGGNAFREFLLLELQHTTESLIKSEEDGERRAKFFLTLVAGAGAVLAFMLGEGAGYHTDQVSWPLVLVLVALLAMGNFVVLRLLTRNLRTDEYKEHLRRMRRWFTPNQSDPRRAWVAFDPFKEKSERELSYWRPKTGGWLEVLLLVIAILGGAVIAALINTDSWLLESLVSLVGSLAAWLLLVWRAKRVMAR